MTTKLTGGCLCGAVRYELASAALSAHNCHCSRCRKTSGAAFASNLYVAKEAFSYSRGEELVAVFELPEARTFAHYFCEVCGSSLPFPSMLRGLVGIPMGTLDADPGIVPSAHIFVDSKASWFRITDALPQHAEGRRAPRR